MKINLEELEKVEREAAIYIDAINAIVPHLLKRVKAAEEIINIARNFPEYFGAQLKSYDEACKDD